LTVVEPTRNGMGGVVFGMVWYSNALLGLSGSGKSPNVLLSIPFLGVVCVSVRGLDTVTLLGAVSAWVELLQRFWVLLFIILFEPAITYAQEGYLVTPITARAWAQAAIDLTGYSDFETTFLPMGRAPRAGETFSLPEQADTLQDIAESRGESFYRGGIAKMI